MNILFISHGLYPCKIGGAEIFNYFLIKELAKSHKLNVATFCNEEIDPNVSLIHLNRRKFGPGRISVPLQDIINIARLRNKIDLVHISYMRADWVLWLPYPLGKQMFGVPYIFTIHDGMYNWKPAFPHEYLFGNADAIVAVSDRLKEEYEKRSRREIKLIPPLIPFKKCDEEKEQLRSGYGLNPEDTILLHLGSIKKIKGCDTLLKAFISLGKDFVEKNKLKLLFAGDGDLRAELEAKVKVEKFDRHIKFLGAVPYERVSTVFKMADIYIIPSLFEGTSISMLEAMFNKLPIIGSDTRGINNVISHGKNGLLFEVSNSEDLKNKIIYLLENENVVKDIAREARMTYERRYNYESVVKQYVDVYERIVKDKQNLIMRQ